MTELFIMMAFGIANALRGNDTLQRLSCASIMAIALSFAYYPSPIVLTGIFIGLIIGLSFGWGKYFMAIDGNDARAEREFLPADWVLDRISPYIKSNYVYGAIGMALRWFIGFIPLMLIISWPDATTGLFRSLTIGIAAGIIYPLSGVICRAVSLERWAVRGAEFFSGIMLGVMIL